ncbi:hypothetical protein EDE08_103112 [Bradyrhizobium sp. R2.2-H]|jgi:hypothetical protein|uniref:hypothetical protein n=1 Tax=unclassified Bradyrhizobium TaxID=2631580 RepID=UPI00105367BD|nr:MULTISPECIES: hypothetical protein [unclassified Bradyrhizobium]TCU74897.1 hypothetical protein EDE10_103111 [Bradyrhizobium sp. Y-H1]TCU77665.1 hypothetical protein EDE08_103112 [Bradyrhizobium sp. R2.2-H]
MAGRVQLFTRKAVDGFSVSIDASTIDGTFTADAIVITVLDAGGNQVGRGEFKITPVKIPEQLIRKAEHRLMTWTEIQDDAKRLRKAVQDALLQDSATIDTARKLLNDFEKDRDELRDYLANRSVDLRAAAGGFLGTNELALSGTVTARIAIDLTLLDADQKPTPSDDAVILTASIEAAGQVRLANEERAAAMRVEVTVTRSAVVNALPSLKIDSVKGFPALDFEWPRIKMQTLDWPEFGSVGIGKLLRLDLPWPGAMGAAPPLRFEPQLKLTFAVNNQALTLAAGPYTGKLVTDPGGDEIADLTDFEFSLSPAGANIAGKLKPAVNPPQVHLQRAFIDRPDILPFTIEVDPSTVNLTIDDEIDLATANLNLNVVATLTLPRVLVRAKSDPSLLLGFSATYEQTFDRAAGKTAGKLTSLKIVEPYPVELIALAAQGAADLAKELIRLVSGIKIPKPDGPDVGLLNLLKRIADMLAAAVRWLARKAGAAVDALLGIAEAVLEALADAIRSLIEKFGKLEASNPHLIIEVRLDARSYALRQILISPAWEAAPGAADTLDFSTAAIDISLPIDWTPALVLDFDRGVDVALVALTGSSAYPFAIGTDLWLARDVGVDAIRETDDQGVRPTKRLIQVTAKQSNVGQGLSLIRLSRGKPTFFEHLKTTVTPINEDRLRLSLLDGPISYEEQLDWKSLGITVAFGDATKRLLPFLQSGGQNGSSFTDSLSQWIEVTAADPEVRGGEATLRLNATLKIKGADVAFPLVIKVRFTDFRVTVEGGDKVTIEGERGKNKFNIFGLNGEILPKNTPPGGTPPDKYNFFQLDFSKGDARLALADSARLDLSYGKVASSGRGIVFRVDELGLSRAGLDLNAKVDRETPVQLAGVDMPFRFDSGGLSIKRSEVQAFSIRGSGQLPPELVGEANATISISMGRGASGSLIVQSAEATLDKSNDPIVCHATRFTLTITALGLEFHNFEDKGAGYHFYFTLTGSAQFKPKPGEFTDGLLKNLSSITITLDKAPLARDPKMLLNKIEFQVAIEPKKRFNVFNLFTFELRGIGFHPASPAFDGRPALSISGQVKFVEAGDIVSPKFDFHKMWIGPAKPGDWRPQIRFDGLTVGVRFGGAASIEATAIAVDEALPSLYRPGALPKDVTARGFLASGKLSIKGWGAMSAAMGFLELQKTNEEQKTIGPPRQAFFIYAQKDKLSIEIPTPLGSIWLREVGFGFGYRFTLAAFNRADQVTDVKGLIKVLDDISKYQGDLASIRSWEPEAEGNRLTLALRGLITLTTASEGSYDADGEKELPNLVLFDIVAALRSDLTFFMNARFWLCRNYADWVDSSANDTWRNNPTLRGYAYLSVPRREFLSRLVADGTGDVEGTHPQLPKPLMEAMKNVRWSATTYIRPGLFHQEFGWPYELAFTFERHESYGELRIDCRGGLVNRVEDGAFLFGIAFKANGYATIGGQVGGRSFGASVTARADFAIDAKFIAYVSVTRSSDTLFYGALSFELTLGLQVRVWLRFKAGLVQVSLEVGFSMSLTISLALEAAAWTNQIAARGSASVVVGAFGRQVRLGIGCSLNADKLDGARARVERFLQLGLTVATPDAEKGVAPPAPELPRAPGVTEADDKIDEALDKQEDVAPVGGGLEPQGEDLRATGYWAMLFLVPGGEPDKRQYVMTFVPRDHSETGLEEKDLPRHDKQGRLLGTFYPPHGADASSADALTIKNLKLARDVTLTRLRWDGKHPDETWTTQDVQLSYNAAAVVARQDSETIPLIDPPDNLKNGFMRSCFVERSDESLHEPKAKRIETDAERLPDNREAAAQALAEANLDQLALGVEDRATNDIEERRSAAIAALCDSAAQLAVGGPKAWDDPAGDGFDVRSFDLAFVVKETDIDVLFKTGINGMPRRANFDLVANTAGIDPLPEHQSVHLFNPPERMFDQLGPKLAEPVIEAVAGGIRLDWDLEPPFERARGIWHDPEFNVKHYRLERTITSRQSTTSLVKPMRITAKSAAALYLGRDAVTAAFVWRYRRRKAQFVDDLADLTPRARALILGANPLANAEGTIDEISLALEDGEVVDVKYTVIPIDCAGTEGPPAQLRLPVRKATPARKGVSRAVMHFEYRKELAEVTADAQPTPDIRLGLDDVGATAKQTRIYMLRVRHERGLATGLYGSDAVTDARVRPLAGDFALKRPTDEDFRLEIASDQKKESYDDPQTISQSENAKFRMVRLDNFLKAIGVDRKPDLRIESPLGVRFALAPLAEANEEPPPWCPVDITLLIDPPIDLAKRGQDVPPKKLPAVGVPVEIFEHPVTMSSAPLISEDLGGDAGRVLVLQPNPTARLAELIDGTSKPIIPVRDGSRRVATRLQWNAQPASSDPIDHDTIDGKTVDRRSARKLGAYFGGFDVFEVDAAGEVEGATSAPEAAAIVYKFKAGNTGDPGSGFLKLGAGDRPYEIHVSIKDVAGKDRARVLDELAASREQIKGQIRLVKDGIPDQWMLFDLLGSSRYAGYHTLSVALKGGAGSFSRNDRIIFAFIRNDAAKHVARVQALPPSLRALEPAEIDDFARLEAQYPSESWRLANAGSSRRASWFSPAESFIVWPQHTPRRSLSISVDEPVLAELLSKGRPKTIFVTLTIPLSRLDAQGKPVTLTPVIRRFLDNAPQPADGFLAPKSVRDIRSLLQDLVWDSNSSAIRKDFSDEPAAFRAARLKIEARSDRKEPVSAEWTIDLDPPLHPVLADVIDWVRYDQVQERFSPYVPLRLKGSLCAWLKEKLTSEGGTATFSLEWPANAVVAEPLLGFVSKGAANFEGRNFRFFTPGPDAADPKSAIVHDIVCAAGRLAVRLDKKAREKIKENPPSAKLTVQLNQGLTEFMETFEIDGLALAQGEELARSFYRRYEPVLEPAPQTNAKDVSAWFDDTPAERDPYGWGILRTLGLAAGLKLYDTETREYLTGKEVLRRLQEAFKKTLPRYGFVPYGQPFVDVISRAGGTTSVASFDGGAPAFNADDLENFLENDALALTQISLRPLVDRISRGWGADGQMKVGNLVDNPVAYFVISASDKENPTTITLENIALPDDVFAVVDILDLTTGLAKPPSFTIVKKQPDPKGPQKTVREALFDGAGELYSIETGPSRNDRPVALARVIVTKGNAHKIFSPDMWVQDGTVKWVVNGTVDALRFPQHKTGKVEKVLAEPFGLFTEISTLRFSALTTRTIADGKTAPLGHDEVLRNIDTLRAYCLRRWPEGWPKPEGEAALIARIPEWTRRFIEHGPALPKQPQDNIDPAEPHFAIAEVTRPDPWRVGVNEDGTMEVLFTHKDRKRRLKRYAVKPFGRYDAFAEALWQAANPQASAEPPKLTGVWIDSSEAVGDIQQKLEQSWDLRFFDIEIPRTEPIAPPVLLDGKRIEIAPEEKIQIIPPAAQSTRRLLEFLFAAHPEEVMSEANVQVEGALSFESVSYGFFREFPTQRWARDIAPDIDTAAKFGDWTPVPEPMALVTTSDQFGGLAESRTIDGRVPGRYTDGWRALRGLRSEALPFFFRSHLVAFASAGVVVSDPVVATVEEGHYNLNLPWHTKVFGALTDVPQWDVTRDNDGVWAIFRLPLVRFVDGMPEDSRQIWLKAGQIQEVFTLPDQVARYELRMITPDRAGLAASSVELDLIGEQRKGNGPKSRYRVNVVGPLFEAAEAVPDLPARQADAVPWWKLFVRAKLKAPDPPADVLFAPAIDTKNFALFELPSSAFAAGEAWPMVAPTAQVVVKVDAVPNTNPHWPTFQANVKVWRDIFQLYAANPMAEKIRQFLDDWAGTTGTTPPPTELPVDAFPAGLPRLETGRPAGVHIVQAVGESWGWPTSAQFGITQRDTLKQLIPSNHDAAYDPALFQSEIATPMRAGMRRVYATQKDRAEWHLNYPPFTTSLDADERGAAALKVALSKDLGGARLWPDCCDVVAAATLTITPGGDTESKVRSLLEAIEAEQFTATATLDLAKAEESALLKGATEIVVHLPGTALGKQAVVDALAALAAPEPEKWRPVSLVLRKAPIGTERERIMSAIAAVVTDAAIQQDLERFVDEQIAAQIFGVCRKPKIKIYRGIAVPQEDDIVRANGGP